MSPRPEFDRYDHHPAESDAFDDWLYETGDLDDDRPDPDEA